MATTTATAAAIKTILGTMTFGAGTSVEVAQQMLQAFGAAGHVELDTAIMYVGGTTERILGDLKAAERFALASKANPKFDTVTKQTTSTEAQRSLSYDKLRLQFELSTAALQTDAIDLYYLHMPDHDTPIEESLRAINSLHVEGKIKRFGMSNYAAWQVMEAHHICKAHGWLTPSVYQGMYNAITREVERELFPCLRRLGIAFYAYNPLAGGMLTGRYNEGDQPTAGRFGGDSFWANAYRARYMQPPQFAALKHISRACEEQGIAIADAAIRWMYHHSALSADAGDGVILGASGLAHLQDNLTSAAAGPLPPSVVTAIDSAWEACRAVCPSYFR